MLMVVIEGNCDAACSESCLSKPTYFILRCWSTSNTLQNFFKPPSSNNLPGQKLYTFHCIHLKATESPACLGPYSRAKEAATVQVPPLLLQMVFVKIAMLTSLFWLPHFESGSSPENGNRAETELNKVRVMAMAPGDAMSNEMLRVCRFALGALWLGRSGHSRHLIILRALPNLWALYHSIGFLRFHATFQDSRMLWRYLVAPGILAFDWHLEH
ncbi:hypothetical protein MJO28_007062 [Puccinia striiformis f. sp. tritici]|uniref:Uncharacterized protein n=1 Tax=Puccinia striiformis f. sp. tritici TaxID=168172 RepID=A0ACC0ECT6_9BASI|nr:hypothetical protein MJO28_007062 [Puccinia striiformis f. sp. tritici]